MKNFCTPLQRLISSPLRAKYIHIVMSRSKTLVKTIAITPHTHSELMALMKLHNLPTYNDAVLWAIRKAQE